MSTATTDTDSPFATGEAACDPATGIERIPTDGDISCEIDTVLVQAGGFSEAPAVDRRRSRRSRHDVPGWLSPSTGNSGNGRPVRVLDLSLHGVGFESDHELEHGDAHWFVVTNGALRLSCRLRVVSCDADGTGSYTVGGEFF